MYLTNSLEKYLKTIYILNMKNGYVRVTDIAEKLNCTKPSVNRAIKSLKEEKLLEYEAYGDITITDKGNELAKEIIKRYDTIKLFLTELLNIDEDKADKEADSMKHAISRDTINKLEQYVNRILNLTELKCRYDENSDKCKKCIKVKIKTKLEGR